MPTRGLDENIIDFINSSDEAKGLREIFESIKNGNKEELFVGIRNNYISIYFKCMGVFKEISFVVNNGKVNFGQVKTAPKYLKPIGKEKADKTLLDIKGITEIKKGIKEHYKGEYKKEKDYQQKTVLSNNKDVDSKWFCVDLEYQTSLYGRFDIIAISKERINGKYRIAIIELKADESSIGTSGNDIQQWVDAGKIKIKDLNNWNLARGSKVTGHFSNFQGFLSDKESVNTLKEDIIRSIQTYKMLKYGGDCLLDLYSDFDTINIVDDFEELPQIVFLNYAVDKEISTVTKTFKGAVFSHEYSIKNVWEQKVIDTWSKYYSCLFIDCYPRKYNFSKLEISEAKNIFDEEAYK